MLPIQSSSPRVFGERARLLVALHQRGVYLGPGYLSGETVQGCGTTSLGHKWGLVASVALAIGVGTLIDGEYVWIRSTAAKPQGENNEDENQNDLKAK